MEPRDEKKLRALQTPQPTGLGKGPAFVATLQTLILFLATKITLPIGLYYASKMYLFEGALGLSELDSCFYSSIVSMVSLQLVVALFIYSAWKQGIRLGEEASKLD